MRYSDSSDGWKMTPEAEKKRDEALKGWGKTTVPLHQPPRLLDTLKEKRETKRAGWTMEYEPSDRARYLADKRGASMADTKQTIDIDAYVKDLKDFKIVQDVYILSDDREDDDTVTVLIKLKPLLSIPANVFDAENNHITNYLTSTKIVGAEEVHVSFQYTEVFK